MHSIRLFHAHSNRKALHLQPFHSTIKRYSQFKSGATFGVLASLLWGQPRGDNCLLMPILVFPITPPMYDYIRVKYTPVSSGRTNVVS